MAVIKVPTTFNIDVEFEIPEFYRRMVALIIDYVIIIIYLRIAAAIFSSLVKGSNIWDTDTQHNLWAVFMLFLYAPPFIYFILMEITMNGQSVGKKIMGMRIVNENGGRASISQFFIRWLLRDIWFLLLFLAGVSMTSEDRDRVGGIIILLMALAYFITEIVLVVSSQKGQRIGDILAHTILIKTNAKASIEETVFQEVADTYTPSFPQIMQLSDRDINAIKSILETARKKGDDNMAYAASDKIKSHLKINTNMPPFQFLDLLLKDYNYLSTK
jgi:uncharacterized RDD family membrane protein YckC